MGREDGLAPRRGTRGRTARRVRLLVLACEGSGSPLSTRRASCSDHTWHGSVMVPAIGAHRIPTGTAPSITLPSAIERASHRATHYGLADPCTPKRGRSAVGWRIRHAPARVTRGLAARAPAHAAPAPTAPYVVKPHERAVPERMRCAPTAGTITEPCHASSEQEARRVLSGEPLPLHAAIRHLTRRAVRPRVPRLGVHASAQHTACS